MHVLSVAIPTAQGTGQNSSGIPVTIAANVTNQTSDGAPPTQGLPLKCFNLTDTSGNQTSVVVQFNRTALAQGDQPPSNQTASPNGDNNGSSGDPQCVTFSFPCFDRRHECLTMWGSSFQFCPSPGGSVSPFANGTNVTFQEVPCPYLNNGTSPGGANPGNSTLTSNGNNE